MRGWGRRRVGLVGAAWVALLEVFGASPRAGAQMPLVAVDAGHNLWAWGATSARGRGEFYFNRELAYEVVAALGRLHLRARLVNADGLIGSLVARTQAVPGVAFFLSVHHDSVPASELAPWVWQGRTLDYDDTWAGHSFFVSRRNADYSESLLCAETMALEVRRAGFVPTRKNARARSYADRELVVHDYDDLVVLYRNPAPAVLFEAGVIKNRTEELLLSDAGRRRRMAEALASGIAACLQVRGAPPR